MPSAGEQRVGNLSVESIRNSQIQLDLAAGITMDTATGDGYTKAAGFEVYCDGTMCWIRGAIKNETGGAISAADTVGYIYGRGHASATAESEIIFPAKTDLTTRYFPCKYGGSSLTDLSTFDHSGTISLVNTSATQITINFEEDGTATLADDEYIWIDISFRVKGRPANGAVAKPSS